MMQTTFGSFVAKRRKELGLTQRELAERILREEDGKSISPQYLNDIERDRRNPTSDHLIEQFASVLKSESAYLFVLAGTIPNSIRKTDITEAQAVEAFKAFRRTSQK